MSEPSQILDTLAEVESAEIKKAFRAILATHAGTRVLFWMLEQCAIYRDAFGGENTNATNYVLGSQAPGRRLIEMLDSLDPRIYPRLLLDMADLRETDRAEAEALSRNSQETDDDE